MTIQKKSGEAAAEAPKPTKHKSFSSMPDISAELAAAIRSTNAAFKKIKLPKSIIFSQHSPNDCAVLKMHLNNPTANMQDDDAAFEGWVFCIICALKGSEHTVNQFILSWQKFSGAEYNKKGVITQGFAAYQRFLFRLIKFRQLFGNSPAIIDPAMSGELERSLAVVPDAKSDIGWPNAESNTDGVWRPGVTINSPCKKDERGKGAATREEAKIEREILARKDSLAAALGIEFPIFGNQFPVGLFIGDPTKDRNRIMPGKKAAIDLWGVDETGITHIFELKKPKAKKVGIISELLFYTYIIDGIQNTGIKYNEIDNKEADKIYKQLPRPDGKRTSWPSINAHFLIFDLHPFITKGVIDTMNHDFCDTGMWLDAYKVDMDTYNFLPYFPEKQKKYFMDRYHMELWRFLEVTSDMRSDHGINNRSEIEKSLNCGCTECGKVFSPSEVSFQAREFENREYLEETGFCPYCKTGLVVGDASGYPITPRFMRICCSNKKEHLVSTGQLYCVTVD